MSAPLYLQLKHLILRGILQGNYPAGSLLPGEHELVAANRMSRITVRKALAELKADGVLSSARGQGTLVTGEIRGFGGEIDMIALVAHAFRPFFGSFFSAFESEAEKRGALVIYKQRLATRHLDAVDFFLRLIEHGIRNVIIWPTADPSSPHSSSDLDQDFFRRVRSIGVNLVIFDQPQPTQFADAVCLDNGHGIRALYARLRQLTTKPIDFVVRERDDGAPMSPNIAARLEAFRSIDDGRGRIHQFSYAQGPSPLVSELSRSRVAPGALLCSTGSVGKACARALTKATGSLALPIAAIGQDANVDADDPVIYYVHPMQRMARECYARLLDQSHAGARWRPRVVQLRGTLTG